MAEQSAEDRLRKLITEALDALPINEQLETMLEQLVERVEADPELRRQAIRQTVRTNMFSGFWRWR